LSYDNRGSIVTSDDDGATWSATVDLTPAPVGGVSRSASAGVLGLASGRVVYVYWTETNSAGLPGVMHVRRSDDDGETWDTASALGGYSESTAAGSQSLFETSAGTLLCTVFGRNTGDTTYRAGVMRSTDDGDTWSGPAAVGAANSGLNEASIVQRSGGTLDAFARSEATNPGQVWHSTSTDDGATWSTPAALPFMCARGMPTAVILSSGRLVLFYRQPSTESSVYRWSDDNGALWSEERTLNTLPSEYVGAVALGTGAVLASAVDAAVGQDSANPGQANLFYRELSA
jgi:hypothetical protein